LFPVKKIIVSIFLAFLVLILIAIIFGKSEYTGETVKSKETTTTTPTTTVETTSTIRKTTSTTTLTSTTEEQTTVIPVQSETNSDCEALGCPPGTMFVGSKTSKKYHNCDCTWAKKISKQNLACFKDIEEAENSGYIPCKVCKPQ
jgi:hypothetical protein